MSNDAARESRNPLAGRQAVLEELRRRPSVSVLVVGGGINGTGLFRELALQGVDVLLVDKSDFCSGASAASTRMIHGGLRYMEFGEFRLVRESLKERNYLLKYAPHYVKPLATTIPIFSRFSGALSCLRRFLRLGGKRPARRGSFLVKIGLTLYDLFTRKERLAPRHQFLSRDETFKRRPLLNPGAVCSARYYDAWISYPERLGIELVLDGEKLCRDARALNHVSLQSAPGDAVTLSDEWTGDVFQVKPRILVNATGGWIDFTNRAVGFDTHMVGGTKGAHLVLDNQTLYDSLQGEMVYYENPDGRVAVILPWLGKVLAGSTDIRVENPDDVSCEEEEIDYMLDSIRGIFPEIEVDRSQILSLFSGVRPLPWSDASATGQVSRDHKCAVIDPTRDTPFPVYSMIGGKWTTFRAFGQHVTDRILKQLGLERRAATDELAIGGGKNYPPTDDAREKWIAGLRKQTRLDEKRLAALLERYGGRAEDLALFLAAGEDRPLEHHEAYTRREVEFLIRNEKIIRPNDLLLRRTAIALLGELSEALLEEILSIMAEVLEWSDEETSKERGRTLEILREKYGIHLSEKVGNRQAGFGRPRRGPT